MSRIKKDPKLLNNINLSTIKKCDTNNNSKVCYDDIHDVQHENHCALACENHNSSKYNYDAKTGMCYCEPFQKKMKGKIYNKEKEKTILSTSSGYGNGLIYHGKKLDNNCNIDTLTCGNYEMSTKKSRGVGNTKTHKAPKTYFEKLDPKNLEMSRCGCDASMVSAYKCNFQPTSSDDFDPSKTIGSAFCKATKEASDSNTLYAQFNKEIDKIIGNGYTDSQKLKRLKALVAFETCRFNNVSNPRIPGGSHDPNDPSTTPKDIVHDWFGKLNTIFKFILAFILLHITLRTFVPKGGDYKDSLLFASVLPPDFLKDYPRHRMLIPIICIVFITIILSIMMTVKGNDNSKTVKEVLSFYLPYSLKSFLNGGIMLTIYCIIYSFILTKGINLLNNNNTHSILINILYRFIFLLVIYGIYFGFGGINMLIQGRPFTDMFPSNENNENVIPSITLIITFISTFIIFILTFFKQNILTDGLFFIITSVIGIFPLAIFLIVINYIIASYQPMAEMALLILYRMSGFIWSMNPKNAFGKILLYILGVRPTDKWVLPFLPWISIPIRLYHYLTDDKALPGYFKPVATSTGVTNTDLWLS
jgi:hypothetical protein